MSTYLRLTPAMRDVLSCLLSSGEEQWGLQVATAAGRPTGTVYPLLERLERERFVTSEWESANGRRGPRRRMYALTEAGKSWATAKGLKTQIDQEDIRDEP